MDIGTSNTEHKKSQRNFVGVSAIFSLGLSILATTFSISAWLNGYHYTNHDTFYFLDKSTERAVSIVPEGLTTSESTIRVSHSTRVGYLRQSEQFPDSVNSQEADICRKQAVAMSILGKKRIATKLFEHSLAVDPFHPDTLNEYGSFLEKDDVVKAEHLFCLALMVQPDHKLALVNRARTLPLVEEIDRDRFNRVDSKRDKLIRIPEGDAAMKRAKKDAYYLNIYHTNAIEGNSMNVMQTRSVIETGDGEAVPVKYPVPGKSLHEHNEILGMDSALRYVNNSLVHRIGEITVGDIRDIHRRVLGFADPLEAGRFRRTQVFVGSHEPPAPQHIEDEMMYFEDWLNSDETLTLHPLEFAALAHYRLVYIHPFIDGNGRTGRLLLNLILMQAGFPPVTIKLSDRQEYYDFLELANKGDIRPFIRFVAKCTERTLDEFLKATTVGVESTFPELAQETLCAEGLCDASTEP